MEPTLEEIFGSYIAWEAKKGTWFINFMNGSENMYLLEGTEKALLIDTGYGTNTLRAFVETLTAKPIIVVNTHYHPDHSAGNGEFEEVYLAEGWEIDAPSVDTPGAVPFNLTKLPHPNYQKQIIGEGDTFDLGGRTIEVLAVKPAHCNSSLFFLDRTERMIFCGDELEAAQVMMFDNSNNPNAPYEVKSRLDNLKANTQRMKDLSSEYDWILPNHNGFPIAAEYLDDYIGLVDAIYHGTAVIEDELHHKYLQMDPKAPELCRVRYQKASIFIKKADVLNVFGKY